MTAARSADGVVVPPSTIVVFSDIACPWATLAVHRLHAARRRLGLDDAVTFEHRSFPLELINERPTPKRTLDAEVPVVGSLAPDFGFQVWTRPESEWPVTVLLALEAVHACREQGARASEQLDLGLRRALFAESRCVSLLHVVLQVAGECPGVDVPALRDALEHGRARHTLAEDLEVSRSDAVTGSPHLFLPDGSDVHNPGVSFHWEGEARSGGFPVVDDDDPSVYDELLRAASTA